MRKAEQRKNEKESKRKNRKMIMIKKGKLLQGYIIPDKPELKIKEYERYGAYYCGICKSIRRRYGQVPRLALSYDSVLLAMTLEAAMEKEAAVRGKAAAEARILPERCLIHPARRKPALQEHPAADHAADMLLALARHKCRDDWRDRRSIPAAAAGWMLSRSCEKISVRHPEICDIMEQEMTRLHRLEEEKCASPDLAADPFSRIMKAVFSITSLIDDERIRMSLGEIGYFTGKWMYLIDALDDLEQDRKQKNYNPLLFLSEKDRRQRITYSLFCTLERLAGEYDGLMSPESRSRSILENIIYFGLHKKTEQILRKAFPRAETPEETENRTEEAETR